MDIKNVSIVKAGKNTPLKFTYDSLSIDIKLDRTYRNGENYTVYIDYTSKPNELKQRAARLLPMLKVYTL
jgi:aminopeptidase N